MYLNLKNRICEYLNINVFKREESDKASVDSTHTLRERAKGNQ